MNTNSDRAAPMTETPLTRPWRTTIRINGVTEDGKAMRVVVPGWDPDQEVTVPFRDINYNVRETVRRRVRYGDFPIRLHTCVNIGAEKAEDLNFSEARYNQWEIPPPPPFEHLDFRPITRNPDLVQCVISVGMGGLYGRPKWLTAGSVDLVKANNGKCYYLKAYLPSGVVDFEHDSSYAFYINLIGVEFERVAYGTSMFTAWIHPDFEEFKIPEATYNPMEHPDATTCDVCTEPHTMLPDGFFTPKTPEEHRKLFQMVSKYALHITIGPTPPKTEPEV